ncbi:uncharacterized protein LOC124939565 [Impatiens glandulifera]|uniref:uncharacterized protein LOC124939565 n=1 Tax=Impatiens glandulifera TaxID=253017 RepID=UPI001FB15DC0|nr:uncharacterized protein LOC124939565 [Impatiens glandulifera]
MGGGAAMRAAAKAATYGAANSVLRGVSQIPSVEYPIAAAARNITRPVSAIVSSSDEVVLTATAQSSKIDATKERSYWESNDWEFAGVEEEDLVLAHDDPIPRLVFGSVPTLHEAKEATSELKDALEKVYNLSSSGSSDSLVSEMFSKSESPFVIKETGVTSVSKPAFQAFKLLSENPAAQSVVASIASDPSVWHAVMENPDLKEFLYSQKSTAPDSVSEKECVSEVKFQDKEAPESVNDSSKSRNGIFDNVKTRVVNMLSGLSGYFENIFGGEKANADGGEKTNADGGENANAYGGKKANADGGEKANADGGEKANTDGGEKAKTKTSFMESVLGASFLGLAIMVILVVVLKRR